MQHIDALSRNPTQDITMCRAIVAVTDNWKHAVQAGDNDIQKIVQSIKNGEETYGNEYVLEADCLFRRPNHGICWVVPQGCRWQILHWNHDEAGHYAAEKTLERIREQFQSPRMRQFVKKYVSACVQCLFFKEETG